MGATNSTMTAGTAGNKDAVNSSNNLLWASFLTQGIAGFGSAYTQSQAQKAQSAFQISQYQTNKELSDWAASDAIKRGDKAAAIKERETAGLVGAEKTAYAAQGVDPGSGSAAQVQSDTESLGELDSLMIRNNAWREAFGYKTQGLNYQGQAAFTKSASDFATRSTLLTGGLQAIQSGMKAGYYYENPERLTRGY